MIYCTIAGLVSPKISTSSNNLGKSSMYFLDIYSLILQRSDSYRFYCAKLTTLWQITSNTLNSPYVYQQIVCELIRLQFMRLSSSFWNYSPSWLEQRQLLRVLLCRQERQLERQFFRVGLYSTVAQKHLKSTYRRWLRSFTIFCIAVSHYPSKTKGSYSDSFASMGMNYVLSMWDLSISCSQVIIFFFLFGNYSQSLLFPPFPFLPINNNQRFIIIIRTLITLIILSLTQHRFLCINQKGNKHLHSLIAINIVYFLNSRKMNKKRGVVMSTANHTKTVSKSKSAHTNPLSQHVYNHSLDRPSNQQGSKSGVINHLVEGNMAESNLISEEPERLVNQAYYTYQDPDYMNRYDGDKHEENQEYVIESMQKRKLYLENCRKEEEKRLLNERNKNNQLKNNRKNTQNSSNKVKGENVCDFKRPLTANKRELQLKNIKKSQPVQQINDKKEKRQLNLNIIKPKPLVFSVNMLGKGSSSPRNYEPQPIDYSTLCSRLPPPNQTPTVRSNLPQYQFQQLGGENLNCKKLPFRFKYML